MLKVKSIPFVGGDTQTFEFDFGTKVAGSVAECPLKIYASLASTIQSPNNVTGNETTGWHEIDAGYGGQNWLDKIKNLDNQCPLFYASSNGQIGQLMVEVDLTPLCNSLFGGSTSAMQAALNSRSYSVDFYAKGSGSNNGVQANGVYFATWHNSGVWAEGNKTLNNMTNAVTKVSTSKNQVTDSNSVGSNYITSGNKMYFLIAAYYPSNGTVPSEVDIDYLNIKVSFARIPDVISPIPITLPDTWSMLIKGASHAWMAGTEDRGHTIFSIAGDLDHRYLLGYEKIRGFEFIKATGSGTWVPSRYLYDATITSLKFQTVNFLIEQTTTGLRMRLLVNGSTVKKYSNTLTDKLIGNFNLFIGHDDVNSSQSDAFINSMVFLPNKTFDDDAEAESVLRGTTEGFENDELVTDGTFQNGLASYPSHGSGISVSPGKAVFTVMGSYINQYIPVLPNNKYVLDIEGNCANGSAEIVNGIDSGVHHYMTKGEFITGPHTTQVGISMYPTAVGQYVTSVSLKLKM